jgi:hypothetical protein
LPYRWPPETRFKIELLKSAEYSLTPIDETGTASTVVRLIYYKPGERASANLQARFTSSFSNANLALAYAREYAFAMAMTFNHDVPTKEARMADGQFDKDFSYLVPFLDKVAAAANNLREPAARDELARLMSDEKSRWARIRQLLSGSEAQQKPEANTTDAQAGAATDNPAAKESFNFTVGSLRSHK